jgi:hypothetical protein
MLQRKPFFVAILFTLMAAGSSVAEDLPGVTATEIKIGNTNAYSGPASAYSVISAFFKMVNDQGGVAGRKINFISIDDGYSPPKTLEQVRRLIEEDQVALLFNTLARRPIRRFSAMSTTRRCHIFSYRQARINLETINTFLGRCASSPVFGPKRKSRPNTF